MGDTDYSQITCPGCYSQGCYEENGQIICNNCSQLLEDIVETGVADEDFVDKGTGPNTGAAALYSNFNTRHVKSQPTIIKIEQLETIDHMGPREPADFGNVPKGVVFNREDYYKSIRMRYVLGVQLMVEYQCQVLVEKFGVNAIVCGIAGEIWLRFVVNTKVFDPTWADQTINNSEKGEKKKRKATNAKFKHEPKNLYDERMAMIWCKSLKKTMPLYCSLAVSYLACHIAREPVLPTDILKWSMEGKLPYFGAFPKIEESIKQIERNYQCPAYICPLTSNYMFRPLNAVPAYKVESMAASIAQAIGLNLPPVNFYAIASRYLKQLSLPVGKIIPYACRIQKWAMPPDLWLSANGFRLPTRVCVVSILMVAIRILYNINGFGKWEMSLSGSIDDSSVDEVGSSSDEYNIKDDAEKMATSATVDGKSDKSLSSAHKFETECAELLKNLEKRYDDLNDKYEFSKDLPTYLQYCKDVVFAGLEPLYRDPGLVEDLWEFYQKNQEIAQSSAAYEADLNQKRDRDSNNVSNTATGNKKPRDGETNCSTPSYNGGSMRQENGSECSESSKSQAHQTSSATEIGESSHILRDIAIRHLKIDMEEHRFFYIPPRVKVKRHDYLHYTRKAPGDGSYTYVAHADYYILLRAFAKVAQVDIRVLHSSVLSLEKRLRWIENRIDQCIEYFNKLGKPSSTTSEQTS